MLPARREMNATYHVPMTDEERLERHLELCHRTYLRLLKEGNWPWPDSLFPEDLVESEDNQSSL